MFQNPGSIGASPIREPATPQDRMNRATKKFLDPLHIVPYCKNRNKHFVVAVPDFHATTGVESRVFSLLHQLALAFHVISTRTSTRETSPTHRAQPKEPCDMPSREERAHPRGARLFNDQVPDDLPAAPMTENARLVLARRYLKKDEAGNPTEATETMFWRVARVIAEEDRSHGASEAVVEELARQFYELMTTGKFEPNSPTLMNAGRPLGQLSACFVLPVDDALSNGKSGIYDTLKSMALVHQSGGGTGFSFSRIRPTGDTVRSTMGVASGPISFMRLYDASTEVVKQGGTRRGANMGILRVDHPNIRDFITCKDDTSQVTNFNISVAITDVFMEAVRTDSEYEMLSPRTGEPMGTDNAREIFDMIVHGAWKTGEPGVFFIDRANEFNPAPALGAYEADEPLWRAASSGV